MSRVDMFEMEELARDILELDDSDSYEDIEEGLIENFNVDMEQFHTVVTALIDYVPYIQSELSGKYYKSFVKNMGGGLMRTIIKVEVGNE